MARLKPATYKAFRECLELFVAHHPVELKASGKLWEDHNARGLTSPRIKSAKVTRLVIEIHPSDNLQEELEILCHEYAHVLSWPTEGGMHSPIWGVHYAELYNHFCA